LRARPVNAK